MDDDAAAAAENRLWSDIDRLRERLTSEEGIPMFLACENLVQGEAGAVPADGTSAALNEKLALAFQRDTETWQRTRSELTVTDLCRIVEVLAARDFAPGSTGEQL